ncbi:ribosomal protein S18-alanine N-acetyltransferase [Kytococcus sedentarius]|uniref:ribosomal protein S18-alanine N-acetyltransferase n=1 Tax=Kytococcus sedentarius TaxID=1276 RepID=UPI0035BBF5E6
MTALLTDAHWRDLPQLAALEADAHPHDAWSEAAWWGELASGRREYVVAVDPGAAGADVPGQRQVLGYAGVDHGGQVADVMTITVHPAARGTGLGRRLMDHLVHSATRRGAEALLLEVRADNEPALRLYEHTGFESLSRRRGYYRGAHGPVDALILRRLLDRSRGGTEPSHAPAPPSPPATPEVSAR